MMTAKGIYLDLTESTYFYRVDEYKFYFSSKFYRGNFIKRYEQEMKKEKIKFESKYNTIITNSMFFAFYIYAKIEKRGFRVEDTRLKNTITQMPFVEFKLV